MTTVFDQEILHQKHKVHFLYNNHSRDIVKIMTIKLMKEYLFSLSLFLIFLYLYIKKPNLIIKLGFNTDIEFGDELFLLLLFFKVFVHRLHSVFTNNIFNLTIIFFIYWFYHRFKTLFITFVLLSCR